MIALILTGTELGQAGLAILVAVIGYILHRKANHIEVLVNGRMVEALREIEELQARLSEFERRLGLEPGESLPTADPKDDTEGRIISKKGG